MNYIKVNEEDEYKIVKITRGKANVINHDLIRELSDVFFALEQDEKTRGVILIGQPNFFSAGLDVIELYGYDEDKMRVFFTEFIGVYIQLMKFTKPMVCGVTGHSPAGGTVLAITADYRIMANNEKFTIGLNEVAVNVQISQALVDGYAFWLGEGVASKLILQGALLSPKEALQIGLVDEIIDDALVLEKCQKKIVQYLMADPDIFVTSKRKLRKNLLHRFEINHSSEELEDSLRIWWKPEVRQRMGLMVDYLQARKSG